MISWYTNDGISPATDHNSELPHVKAITPESQPGVEVSMLSFAWRNVTGLLIYIYMYIYIYLYICVYIYIYHIDTYYVVFLSIHLLYAYNLQIQLYIYIYIFKYVQMISQQSKVYSMDLFLFPYIYTIYMCLYTEHRNSWLLWMFIPKNMVWLVLNHTYIYIR